MPGMINIALYKGGIRIHVQTDTGKYCIIPMPGIRSVIDSNGNPAVDHVAITNVLGADDPTKTLVTQMIGVGIKLVVETENGEPQTLGTIQSITRKPF